VAEVEVEVAGQSLAPLLTIHSTYDLLEVAVEEEAVHIVSNRG
jgi:hypothetical protein